MKLVVRSDAYHEWILLGSFHLLESIPNARLQLGIVIKVLHHYLRFVFLWLLFHLAAEVPEDDGQKNTGQETGPVVEEYTVYVKDLEKLVLLIDEVE